MFNKKNLSITISVSSIILIIVAGLFYYFVYFNKETALQEVSYEKQQNKERQKILIEEKIKKQIIELSQLNKEYNVSKPASKLIKKQIKELDKIRSRY